MKTLRLLPAFLFLLGPVVDGRSTLPAAYATPQATIASYWHRMLEHRHAEALQCFDGYKGNDTVRMLGLPSLVELRCKDFRLNYQGRGIADVSYTVEYRIAMGDPLSHFETGDRMHFTSSGWRIGRPLLVASEPL